MFERRTSCYTFLLDLQTVHSSQAPSQLPSTSCAFSWIASCDPQIPHKAAYNPRWPPCWLEIWGHHCTQDLGCMNGSLLSTGLASHIVLQALYRSSFSVTKSWRITSNKVKRFILAHGFGGFTQWYSQLHSLQACGEEGSCLLPSNQKQKRRTGRSGDLKTAYKDAPPVT